MLNRFNKFAPRDYSWQTAIPELPELNVEMLDSTMGNLQNSITQSNLLSKQRPQVLNNKPDLELYQEYKTMVDSGLQKVTDSYKTGGFKAGQAAYNQFLQQVTDEWRPGGRANLLNERFNAYKNATEEINKFAKDDKRSINTSLAKFQLQEELSKPIDYNPDIRKGNSIKTPDLYKDPDLRSAVDDMLKEIKTNGTTSFLGDFNRDWWVNKISTETREEERIKLAAEALMSQPEFQAQLQRDVQYKTYTTDKNKYEKSFIESEKQRLDKFTKASEKAKTSPKETKDWQNFLREQGYNIEVDGQFGTLTEEATKQFLDSQKSRTFDFNEQLTSEVKQNYMDYALRAAYKKVDVTPIFNKAIKAKADIQNAREANKINRERLEFEQKDASLVTVVSGISQQLPDIQKHYEDTKKLKNEFEGQMNNAIQKSAFNGWTIDNIATAYLKWDKAEGQTLDEKVNNFKRLLNENGSFTFNNDQVDLLVKEMMAPSNQSSVKTMLETYAELQDETSRFEDLQVGLGKQYIQTPEGRDALSKLEPFRLKGESDEQLMRRLVQNPQQFRETKTVYLPGRMTDGRTIEEVQQVGEAVLNKMKSDMKNQEQSGFKYDFTSLGTYEVYTHKDDTNLRPVLDNISLAIESGTGLNFSTFGKIGLSFKDFEGEDVKSDGVKKVKSIAPAKNNKGEPIFKVDLTFTDKKGKVKDGYTEINVIPGSPEQRQTVNGLKSSYIDLVKSGNSTSAMGVLDLIDAFEGKNGLKQASVDLTLKNLNTKNTQLRPVYTESTINGQKQLVDIRQYGWQVADLGMDENIAGRKLKTYGINTQSGNFAASVVVDDNGNEILVPDDSGNALFPSSSGVRKNLLGMVIKSNTPVNGKN